MLHPTTKSSGLRYYVSDDASQIDDRSDEDLMMRRLCVLHRVIFWKFSLLCLAAVVAFYNRARITAPRICAYSEFRALSLEALGE